jgi:hypothetical protein
MSSASETLSKGPAANALGRDGSEEAFDTLRIDVLPSLLRQ